MCGICVPHCPTFGLTQNEADGPRGRISLALGLSSGQLAADATVVDHLDRCLSCLACESVCPSRVAYGSLMDHLRTALAAGDFTADMTNQRTPDTTTVDEAALPKAARRIWAALRNRVLSRRRMMGRLGSLLRILQRLGLGGALRTLGGPWGRALPRQLPKRFHPAAHRPATHKTNETGRSARRVGLFIGCTGEALNSDAVRAGIRVLQALGHIVETPERQACCGAMHQHGGDLVEAARLRAENRQVFSAPDLTAIVVLGTACTAELQREAQAAPVVEITDYLVNLPDTDWPPLNPLVIRAGIHLPCSQTRVLKQPGSTERLLRRIPDLTPVPLATNDRCCGAAGMHVLMYPDQAEALRAPKLAEIERLKPDCVVSANIGCATHLAAGLGVAVRHPVELIARALA